MANEFKIKRGDGAPNNGSIENYELVYDYTNNDLWTKHGGQVYKVAGGNVGTVTNVVAGNGLTGGGTSTATLDVGAGTGISVSSNAIAVSGLTVSEFAANSIQLSSESFADNNTSLMTSAAIADKIEAYGYSTGAGNVDTSGSPVDNDYAKFTDANTIEGRSITEMKLDLNFGELADLDAIPTSKVTSGTFADARIALSNITQHTDPKYLRSDTSDSVGGDLDLGSGNVHIKKTGGNNTNNYAAVELYSAGTADNQAAIAIQQQTSEGDTIIFADFEPHVEWGISTENGANEVHFTGGSSTGSLGSKTLKNNAGADRTAYKKVVINNTDGNVSVGGTLTAGGFTTAGTVTAGASSNQIRLRTVSNASPIADTFAGNTEQSYIDFLESTSTNDPGYIMHETRDEAETNEGVIHLCPSDDNADGDYISIHGTNDADSLKLHTSGKIEGVSTLTATSIVLGGHTMNDIDIGSEFVDTDDHLMTSGAIKEKIESYGYSTGGGISHDGSTANGVLTYKDADEATVESTLTYNGSTLTFDGSNDGNRNIELGSGGSGTAFIDLIASDTYTDYSLRLIRWSGDNSTSDLTHRGTGDLRFITSDAANILWLTGGAEKMRLVHSNGRLGLGTNSPAYDLHVDGHAYASSSFLGPDGSAGTPTYRFHNDGDTGMYLSATGTIAFSTAGAARMTIDSNGILYVSNKVQAGSAGVEIWDGTHGFKPVILKDSTYTKLLNNDGAVNIYLGDSGDGNNYYNSGGHRFRSMDGGTYFAAINSTGLRIGTGSSFASETLEVNGTSKFTTTGNTTLYIDGAGNGYTQGCIIFRGTDDDASYRGQGTYYHDAASDIEYFSGTLYANDAWAVCRKTSVSSHDGSVAIGANALLMIEGGGDIGIGIENPTAKLHVKDATDISMSSSSDGQLKVEGNGYTGGIALNGSAMHIYHNSSSRNLVLGTNETARYQIDGSGNHSIYGNTSFSSPMSVQYGVTINEGGHDSDTRIEGDTDTNLVRVDASTERVGIGTGSPGHKLDVNGSIRAQDGNVFYGDSTSGVLSTGSWYGDLGSNGFERVCGLSHDGGEFVIVEKNGQVSTLIDGSYFAYEAGSNQGGGFYSSSDSSYANATGIVASGGTLYVKQADGTNASLFSTGDIICNSGYISGQGNDLHLRRTTNNDDRITIEASEHKFIIDAVERLSLTSSGVTCGQINVARNANPNADTTMAINLSGSYGGGIHFTDTKHSGIWCLGSGTEMHFGVGGSTYAGLSSDQGLFMMHDNGDFHANEDVIAFSSSVGSDKKFKKNIKDSSYGLSDVMKMRSVEYDWIEKRKGKHDIGVIAQEIEKIIPEVVQDVQSIGGSEGTHKVVDYGKLASVLIKAIQEQQVQIDELKTKLGE